MDGVYTGTIDGFENDTCGFVTYPGAPPDPNRFVTAYTGNPTIRNTSPTQFRVDYGSLAVDCDYLDPGVDCAGYRVPVPPMRWDVTVTDVVLASDHAFTQRESISVTCTQPNCAYFGTFPCAFDILETFELPPDESAYCFDGADNDFDGATDHEDPDCPAFTAAFWSVSSEFGVDAEGGVVPFVLDGVSHPVTLTITITAAEWHQYGMFATQSSDPAQTCDVTLTYTGTDPIPTTLELVDPVYSTVVHHAWTLPAGQYSVTSDCQSKGLVSTASYGTIDDIAALTWGVSVGEPLFPYPLGPYGVHQADRFGASALFGLDGTRYGYSQWALGYEVDASLNVLNESGGVADAVDILADTLLERDPTTVSGLLPLPAGAYLVDGDSLFLRD